MTQYALAKPTILILDDDSDVLNSLQFLLETHGFAVRTFRSAPALLSWAKVNPFDCVVVDYKMPEIDGLQVTSRLRALGIKAPILLITGFPDETISTKATAAGAQEVLLKPHLEVNLVTQIERRLQERVADR